MAHEKDLKARTKRYALAIINLVSKLPANRTADVLGKQLLRSATSVGANYREASRARSKAEFIAKIGDCLREADESEYWLELLAESNTIDASNIDPHLQETRELLAILTTILKNAKANTGSS